MYLSKVALLKHFHAKQFLLHPQGNQAYVAHQLLWKLFTNEEQRNFLFREEITKTGDKEFYVLSQKKPLKASGFLVQTKEFQPNLAVYQRLAFSLRINPTICITHNGSKNRHDVLMHAKTQAKQEGITSKFKLRDLMTASAQDWLLDEKRQRDWGISFNFAPDVESYQQHQYHKKNGQIMQFSSIDVQGTLTIQNSQRFMQKYTEGFGRAKGFGCGLMLIRKI